MRVLIDTCIIIDLLQKRENFYEDAEIISLLCANKHFVGFITAKSFTDIYYICYKQTHSSESSRKILSNLCKIFDILDTSKTDIYNAILSNITDFEDAVMIETGIRSNVDCIITRNINDCSNSKIPVYTPKEFIKIESENYTS